MNHTKNRKRSRRGAAAAADTGINLQTHPHAAGIDVGAGEFVVAVPPGCCTQSVRCFPSFTSGVRQLRDWLKDCGITTVAMESTGNYWVTLFDTLTEAGIAVCLVNARHVKAVPGRKTDIQDAQWLQQLHAAGLLRGSFRPAPDIVPLRFLMRHRSEMIRESARHLQLMQKSLTEMNLKLQHVFSDIDGTSALAIIDAILAGERDPEQLAALRDRRCRTPKATIIEALRGDYRPAYLFVLRQSRAAWEHIQSAIATCDEQITALVAAAGPAADAESPPGGGTRLQDRSGKSEDEPTADQAAQRRREKKRNKNAPRYPVREEAMRFYGVDLGAVDGVGTGLLASLMSELGTREQILENFSSAEKLASWLGACPDNRISGGRILKAKTRKVTSPLAHAFRLAVFGLEQSRSRMGEHYRRMKARLGKAEGLVATMHKLVRIIYGMLRNRAEWSEEEAFKITPQNLARRRARIMKEAAAIGMQVVAAA